MGCDRKGAHWLSWYQLLLCKCRFESLSVTPTSYWWTQGGYLLAKIAPTLPCLSSMIGQCIMQNGTWLWQSIPRWQWTSCDSVYRSTSTAVLHQWWTAVLGEEKWRLSSAFRISTWISELSCCFAPCMCELLHVKCLLSILTDKYKFFISEFSC